MQVSNKDPDVLYHYTTMKGLIGILESKELWATNILYLNDGSEFKYTFDLFTNEITKYPLNSIDLKGVQKDKFFLYFADYAELYNTIYEEYSKIKQYYVFSLSQEEDLLSQWRGYCGNEKGFCIGFNYSFLKKYAESNNNSLYPCIYDIDEQTQVIKGLVINLVDSLAKDYIANNGNWDLNKHFNEDEFAIMRTIMEKATIFKNPSFNEEGEYRLFIGSYKNEEHIKNIHYREGNNTIIPYIKMPLLKENIFRKLLPQKKDSKINQIINKIIIGPTTHPSLSKKAVEMLLESNGFQSDIVSISKIPYRSV